jgi:hypothetical protein
VVETQLKATSAAYERLSLSLLQAVHDTDLKEILAATT